MAGESLRVESAFIAVKPATPSLADGRLAAAADHDVRLAVADQRQAVGEVVVAGRAGGTTQWFGPRSRTGST